MCRLKQDSISGLPRPKEEGQPPPRPLEDEALRRVTGGMRPIAAGDEPKDPKDGGPPGT